MPEMDDLMENEMETGIIHTILGYRAEGLQGFSVSIFVETKVRCIAPQTLLRTPLYTLT